jgi:hypothetical protein
MQPGMKTRSLRFWSQPNTIEPIVTIPGEYVESIVLRAVGHETGHAIAAHHHQARVRGIAIEVMSAQGQWRTIFKTLYESMDWSIETCCVVKAAGPAADLLYQGGFSDESASGDLHDIEGFTGRASLEPYLSMAKEILAEHPTPFTCITAALREAIETAEDRFLEKLPDNTIGAYLLDEEQLLPYLNGSR